MKPYYEHLGITIYHGDCRDILPHLEPVDLVLTDPPYGLNRGSFFAKKARGISEEKIKWDDEPPDLEIFREIERVSKEQIIWGANYFNCFNGNHGALVWNKIQPLENLSQAEIASFSKSKKIYMFTERWTNYVNTKETGHPTEKSLKLMLWCIKLLSAETILDPFMGSGTTLVAAKQLGRKAIGIEIEEKYCEIAVKRLAQEVLPL